MHFCFRLGDQLSAEHFQTVPGRTQLDWIQCIFICFVETTRTVIPSQFLSFTFFFHYKSVVKLAELMYSLRCCYWLVF